MDEYLHVAGFFARANEAQSAFSSPAAQGLEDKWRPLPVNDLAPAVRAPNSQNDDTLDKDTT
jgi:hypothetical protein